MSEALVNRFYDFFKELEPIATQEGRDELQRFAQGIEAGKPTSLQKLLKTKTRNIAAEGRQACQFGYALPPMDRLRLYELIIQAQGAEPLNEDLKIIGKSVADTINMNDDETCADAIHLVLGKNEVRERKPPAKDPENPSYDEYTTINEQSALAWIRRSLSTDLPKALDMKCGDFNDMFLTKEELGKIWALLLIPSQDEMAQQSHNIDRRRILQETELCPTMWRSFKKMCRDLQSMDGEIVTETAINIMDGVIEHVVKNIPDEELRILPPKRAFYLSRALHATRYTVEATESFETMQASFFKKHEVPASIQTQRAAIIKKIDADLSASGNEDLANFRAAKRLIKGTDAKGTQIAYNFMARYLGDMMDIPFVPAIESVQSPRKITNLAQYEPWIIENNMPIWSNKVMIFEDTDNAEEPMINRGFRDKLRSTAHELLHAMDIQSMHTLGTALRHKEFMSLFAENAKNATALDAQTELGQSYMFLSTTYNVGTRAVYTDSDEAAYATQPVEKWVHEFDQSFVTTINGQIVKDEVEQGQRNLLDELSSALKQTIYYFGLRGLWRGDDATSAEAQNDYIALHDLSPYGSSTLHLDTTKKEQTANGYKQPRLSDFENKAQVHLALTEAIEYLKKAPTNEPDTLLAIFQMAGDYLGQTATEARALFHHIKDKPRKHQDAGEGRTAKGLLTALKDFAETANEIGGDLHDYAAVMTRPQKLKPTPPAPTNT